MLKPFFPLSISIRGKGLLSHVKGQHATTLGDSVQAKLPEAPAFMLL